MIRLASTGWWSSAQRWAARRLPSSRPTSPTQRPSSALRRPASARSMKSAAHAACRALASPSSPAATNRAAAC